MADRAVGGSVPSSFRSGLPKNKRNRGLIYYKEGGVFIKFLFTGGLPTLPSSLFLFCLSGTPPRSFFMRILVQAVSESEDGPWVEPPAAPELQSPAAVFAGDGSFTIFNQNISI